MKKKLLTMIYIGVFALSLAGCDKDKDKNEDKKTTESTVEFDLPDLDEPKDTEETTETTTEEPTTEEVVENDGWEVVGSDRTGYVELPEDWTEHESEADGGLKYSLQYLAPAEDGLVTLLDSDYDFDENQYEVEDPADIVTQAYIEQYGAMGGENEEVDQVTMDGIDFYRTIDVLPEGTYTDYEYVLYTYVAYDNSRFYTVIIEGERSVVEDMAISVETTFSVDGEAASTGNTGGTETTGNDVVAGKTDWETYFVCVDGEEYTLPCDFSEFAADGWILDESSDGELIEYDDYVYAFIEKGDIQMSIIVANKYDEAEIAVDKGQIIGVELDFNVEDIECFIEGGIALGAPYDVVLEAFGTPDDIYEDDEEDYKQITYYGATYADDWYTKLEITFENGVATEIEIVHW